MRDIYFTGKITQPRIQDLVTSIRKTIGQKRVLISSPGGNFEFFSVFGPVLARLGFTSIAADIYSAAIILYLLGNDRIALPDAEFYFHEVCILPEMGGLTLCNLEDALYYEQHKSPHRENIEDIYVEMRNSQDWLVSFVCERTNVSKGILLKLMRAGATLSAKEALHYGIVNRIVSEDELAFGRVGE